MTAAPPYNRQYNFTNYQALSPNLPLPATPLDIEFNAVKITTDAIEANLALIQRSDGALANATVGPAQLSPSLALGVTNRGVFAPGTTYNASDAVFEAGVFYICILGYKATATLPGADPTHWSVGADFNASIITSAVNAASTASVYRTYPTRTAFAASSINSTITSAIMLGYANPGDCEPHTYLKLGATPSPAQAWNVQTADGAWWALATQRIDVRMFGAATTASDNTTAINNAIAYASIGGGAVRIPAGTWKVSGTLTISAAGVTLFGDGQTATMLTFTAGTADCIVVTGPNYPGQLHGTGVHDLTISAAARTGGRAIYNAWTLRSYYDRLNLANVWNGIESYSCNGTDLRLIGITTINNPSGFGVYCHSTADGSESTEVVNITNLVINAGYTGADGLRFDGMVQTINMQTVTGLHVNRFLWFQNTAQATNGGLIPAFVEGWNCVSDGVMLRSVQIDDGNQMHFVGCWFENTTNPAGAPQGFQDQEAVLIGAGFATTRDIAFTSCTIGNCKQDAMTIHGQSVKIANCRINAPSIAGPGLFNGIVIGADAVDVTVSNCTFHWFGSPINSNYHVYVTAGSERVGITGGNYYGYVTNAVFWGNTDSESYCTPGVNQVALLHGPGRVTIESRTVTGSFTATAVQVLGGLLVLGGTPGDFNLTVPTAAALVAADAFAFYNGAFDWTVCNGTNGICTILSGVAGVTLFGVTSSGNFVIAAGATRTFRVVYTNAAQGSGSEAVTIAA